MDRCYFLICCIIATLSGASCSSEFNPEDSTLPSLVKEVEDNSRYKTFEANVTLLKLLVSDKNGVSKSEVFDMLHSRDDNPSHVDLPDFPEDTEVASADVPSPPKSQAEFLQAPEEIVVKDSPRRVSYAGSRGEPIGAAAGIMVVVTCSIVLLGYTGLVVWRKVYLKRNGLKHELLRNEEMIAETRLDM